MDEIVIEDLEVYAYHGVFEEEKEKGQNFYVTVKMKVEDLTSVDDLSNTIDYGAVASAIVFFVEKTKFDLIESVAHGIADMIIKGYDLVKEVEVTIKKPNAPIKYKFGNVMVTVRKKWHIAYIGIGSNLGDRKEYLDMAVRGFNRMDSDILKVSSYMETKPYGVTDQPDFLNGVIKIRTLLNPHQLLKVCQSLEEKANRVRTRRWGERTLDVDILLFDDEIINTEELIVPHLELHMRGFVLKPLVEIDPGVVHPVLHKSAYQLLKELESEHTDN